MSSDLWGNMVSGAVGGLLALGGTALLQSLRTRQEAKYLRARRTAGRERRIRRLYLLLLTQLESLVGVGFNAINGRHDIHECQGMILDFYRNTDSRIGERLMLLETNPQGRTMIAKGKAALYAFLPLCHGRPVTTTQENLREAVQGAMRAHDHVASWIFGDRFPSDKYIPREW